MDPPSPSDNPFVSYFPDIERTFDEQPDTSDPFVLNPFDPVDDDTWLTGDVYTTSDDTWNGYLINDAYPRYLPYLPGTPTNPEWDEYSITTVPDVLRTLPQPLEQFEEPVILAPFSPLIAALLPPLPPPDAAEEALLTMTTLSPQDLQTLIAGVLSSIPALTQPAPAAPTGHSGLKISPPPRFSFSKSCTVYDFTAACELVFDYHRITGDWDRIHYGQSYLEGVPAIWARSKIDSLDATQKAAYTWANFKSHLIGVYGDPDRRLKAAFTIRALKQKTSAAVYSSEFYALAALVEWDDVALRDQFYSGLKTEVQVEIARQAFPANLSDLATLAIRIDSRLFEGRKQTHGTNPFRNQHSGQYQSSSQRPIRDPNAMDVDATGTARPRLTDQLRDQLRKEGKCFRCRQKGHMSRDCTAFDQKPQGTATASTSRNPFRPQNRVAATNYRFDPETGLPNTAYITATRFDPDTGLPNPAYNVSSSSPSSSSSVPPSSFQ